MGGTFRASPTYLLRRQLRELGHLITSAFACF